MKKVFDSKIFIEICKLEISKLQKIQEIKYKFKLKGQYLIFQISIQIYESINLKLIENVRIFKRINLMSKIYFSSSNQFMFEKPIQIMGEKKAFLSSLLKAFICCASGKHFDLKIKYFMEGKITKSIL